MKIYKLETLQIEIGGDKAWVVGVTYFNDATGEGVIVPVVFETPEDADDAMALYKKIAELQGGEAMPPEESPFSSN